MASTDPERRDEEESTGAAEDEDTGAQIAPIIKLEEVAVTTGEEEEDAFLDLKAKLYRFDKEGNQWKERGHGSIKLLKHKETGKVRIVMRQAKTLKICANHYVFPEIKLQEHAGNEKSCVWHAPDFSDGEVKDEMFAIRFGSVENCKNFMESVEKIAESLGKNDEKESKEATEAASLLDNLTVSKSKTEGGAPEEATVAAASPEEATVTAAEKKEKKSETVTD
ncbi:ran-binding protein 1-like protein c-like [Iris pallida]|uniref:Ran-binding protein 1-like protein c-like n=1 Tax=Iris pallida TaxID=29817 RepID=A0AAX6DPC4_IRIPA|nr:ran-binding protein 1-like protein c-like [Iris pallida]